jgi:hypothetical protein
MEATRLCAGEIKSKSVAHGFIPCVWVLGEVLLHEALRFPALFSMGCDLLSFCTRFGDSPKFCIYSLLVNSSRTSCGWIFESGGLMAVSEVILR